MNKHKKYLSSLYGKKFMKKYYDTQEKTGINNADNKNIISLAGSASFIFFISLMGYFIAYGFEFLRALNYGFDIDLIVITPSILIKNNFKALPFILIIRFFSQLIYAENKVNIGKNKKNSLNKNQKYTLIFITLILFVDIALTIHYEKYYYFFITLLCLAIMVFAYFFSEVFKIKALTNKIITFVSLVSFVPIIIVPCIEYSQLFRNFSYSSFNHLNDKYILLSIYNENIIANKITASKNDPNCYQIVKDNDDSILVLKNLDLEKGMIFSKLNVVEKGCSTSSKTEKNDNSKIK